MKEKEMQADIDTNDLRALDDNFASADTTSSEFSPIPDGSYQVIVDKVKLSYSKNSGNPMLEWTLKILGPSCQGRLLWKYSAITEKKRGFSKTRPSSRVDCSCKSFLSFHSTLTLF